MAGIVFGCIAPHPPLIVPGIGSDLDKQPVVKTISAMKDLADSLALSRPDSIVIVSPHSYYTDQMKMTISFTEFAEGNLHEWGTNIAGHRFENDVELANLILKNARDKDIPVKSIQQNPYNLDHGILVPIHYLSKATKGLPLIPISFSYLPLKSHFAFGQAIRKAAEQSKKRVAFIASGDLSHYLKGSNYGYHPEGAVFEQQLAEALSYINTEAVLNLDPELVERAGECGLRSIVILLGALDGLEVKSKILSHEGPFGVGYMVVSFQVKQ